MRNDLVIYNQICFKLEHYANKYFHTGYVVAGEINNQKGQFVEIILQILSLKFRDPSDLAYIRLLCQDYTDSSLLEIPDENLKEIFSEFERMMKL